MIKIFQVLNSTLEKLAEKQSSFIVEMFFGIKTPTEENFNDYYKTTWEGDIGTTDLQEIFKIFNMEHPKDFKGRSLSCGDIVETPSGKYACMSCSWKKLNY